jgi:hypothetical protein
MEEWTRDEFLAYILIYAALADYTEGQEETDFIKAEIGESVYQEIKEEFDADSDMERINKIANYSSGEEFDKEYADMVMHEVTDLFLADGEYSLLEKNLRRALKHIINNS